MSHDEEPPDGAEEALRELELATHNLASNPRSAIALADLTAFRKSRRAITAFQHIMERSTSRDVQLHAVLALHEAIMREWHALGVGQVAAVRRLLLEWPLAHVAHLEVRVRSRLYELAATIFKREAAEESSEAKGGAEWFAAIASTLLSASEVCESHESVSSC